MQVKSTAEGEHSAIFSTLIKLPIVIKIFIVSYFEWPFYTGFTVQARFLHDTSYSDPPLCRLANFTGNYC